MKKRGNMVSQKGTGGEKGRRRVPLTRAPQPPRRSLEETKTIRDDPGFRGNFRRQAALQVSF